MPAQSYVASTNCTSDFCCNQQYSVTAITTAAAAIAERYAYTAYGLPTILNASATIIATSAISNRYTYTGREWDATLGLHHFRARWMSPIAGRFLGRDPIGYQGSMWGLYELFDASVLTSTDPLGLFSGTCTCHCGGGPSRHGIPVQVTPACGGNADSCCRKACDTIMTFCVYRALPGEDGGVSGTIYVPAEFENGRYKCPYPNRCHERLEHLACGYFPTKCSKIACKLACGAGGIACGAACDRLFGGSPNPRKMKALMACRFLCGAVALGCSISCESCENP
jgi:RHS repeat-associated protein